MLIIGRITPVPSVGPSENDLTRYLLCMLTHLVVLSCPTPESKLSTGDLSLNLGMLSFAEPHTGGKSREISRWPTLPANSQNGAQIGAQ
jgi:hypothetical protein